MYNSIQNMHEMYFKHSHSNSEYLLYLPTTAGTPQGHKVFTFYTQMYM